MTFFFEITIIVFIAVFLGTIMKLFRQPLIVGYVFTGVVMGPYVFNLLHSTSDIEIFSTIGISILLFIVGIHLNPEIIKEVGVTSFIVAVAEFIITSIAGFYVAKMLGFNDVSAAYSSVALAFSSTIIVMKLFTDKKCLNKLHGKIVLGMLLIEDFIAALILIVASLNVSASSTGADLEHIFLILLFKGIVIGVLLFLVSKYLLPRLSNFFASSPELLFLFSIAWGLGFSSLFSVIGFSAGIGALVAGASFSVSPFAEEIGSRLKPLRDFFIMIFFVLLGSKISLIIDTNIIYPAILLSLYVLVVNPIIVFFVMNLLGYKKRISFLVAVTASQISEFSLILVALGSSNGQISDQLVSVVTLVFVFTVVVSTYLILYSEVIYERFRSIISFFELRHGSKGERSLDENNFDMILFGYHRVGEDFIKAAKSIGAKYFAVDFNPSAITRLQNEGIPFKYGDADDVEFLKEINISDAKLIVSTIPDFETNLLLTKTYRSENQSGIVISMSHDVSQAKKLYLAGATYVVMPHYLGANQASKMIEKYGFDVEFFDRERNEHLLHLEKRQK
ncbi:MAG: cation:proton antiporter [Candidatus Paceibacterota bacterium]